MLISALLGFLVWLIKPQRIWAAMVRFGDFVRGKKKVSRFDDTET
ncbi:MAG: hypothetical protein ACI30I_06275 [Parabacteroides sp.]